MTSSLRNLRLVYNGGDVSDQQRGDEEGSSNGLRVQELAVTGDERGGKSVAVVLLKVDEAAREDEDVALGDGLGYKLVSGGDEVDVEGALEDENNMQRAGGCAAG